MSSSGEYYQTRGGAATNLPIPPDIAPEATLTPHRWGMASFLFSEVAFFSTLIVAYITFRGTDQVGPTPAEALSLPLVVGSTICLLSSSVTIHLATRALERGQPGMFRLWWAATIGLALAFLAGTAYEWHELITVHQLTISRNLFGTTYYTLVGFHALHVTVGVIAMAIVLGIAWRGYVAREHAEGAELVSWYWHFVDAVWIVVFTVVYL